MPNITNLKISGITYTIYDETAHTSLDELTSVVNGKANSSDVYSKDAADEKFIAASASTSITEGFATQEWVENKGYLTEHQSLADYAKTTAVTASIESAINEIEIPSVENYFDGAVYDSDNHRINFKHGDDVKAYIDASPFLVDGMVDNVEISEGKLVITFNTDAGKQNIEIPISNIFDANNYYNKSAIDTALAAKANTADTYTKSEVDSAVSSAETNAKAYASGYTYDKDTIDQKVADSGIFDSSLYYNKTEVNDLLANKANADDVPTTTSDLTNDSGFVSVSIDGTTLVFN